MTRVNVIQTASANSQLSEPGKRVPDVATVADRVGSIPHYERVRILTRHASRNAMIGPVPTHVEPSRYAPRYELRGPLINGISDWSNLRALLLGQRPVIHLNSNGRDYQGTAVIRLTNPNDEAITVNLQADQSPLSPARFAVSRSSVTIHAHGTVAVTVSADVPPMPTPMVSGLLFITNGNAQASPRWFQPFEVAFDAMREPPPLPPKETELTGIRRMTR